jgi:hypothetical protein
MAYNLSSMSDMELEHLHGNAIRLSQSGTPQQRAQAEQLLPGIGKEIARCRRAHVTGVNRKRVDALDARRAKAKKASGKKPETKTS